MSGPSRSALRSGKPAARNVYDQKTINKVLKLVNQGYTQSCVAAACGVSRGTVTNIVHGKVTVVRNPKECRSDELKIFARGKPGQCPTHGRIKLPCVICAAEKFRQEHPEREWLDPLPELNAERTQKEIAAQMRWFDEVDQFVNKGIT